MRRLRSASFGVPPGDECKKLMTRCEKLLATHLGLGQLALV